MIASLEKLNTYSKNNLKIYGDKEDIDLLDIVRKTGLYNTSFAICGCPDTPKYELIIYLLKSALSDIDLNKKYLNLYEFSLNNLLAYLNGVVKKEYINTITPMLSSFLQSNSGEDEYCSLMAINTMLLIYLSLDSALMIIDVIYSIKSMMIASSSENEKKSYYLINKEIDYSILKKIEKYLDPVN